MLPRNLLWLLLLLLDEHWMSHRLLSLMTLLAHHRLLLRLLWLSNLLVLLLQLALLIVHRLRLLQNVLLLGLVWRSLDLCLLVDLNILSVLRRLLLQLLWCFLSWLYGMLLLLMLAPCRGGEQRLLRGILAVGLADILRRDSLKMLLLLLRLGRRQLLSIASRRDALVVHWLVLLLRIVELCVLARTVVLIRLIISTDVLRSISGTSAGSRCLHLLQVTWSRAGVRVTGCLRLRFTVAVLGPRLMR